MFKIHAYCCAAQYFAVPSTEKKEKDNSDSHCIYLGYVQYFTHSNKQCEKTKIATQTNKDPADTRDYKKPSLHHYSIQASTWFFFKTFKCTGNIHDC